MSFSDTPIDKNTVTSDNMAAAVPPSENKFDAENVSEPNALSEGMITEEKATTSEAISEVVTADNTDTVAEIPNTEHTPKAPADAASEVPAEGISNADEPLSTYPASDHCATEAQPTPPIPPHVSPRVNDNEITGGPTMISPRYGNTAQNPPFNHSPYAAPDNNYPHNPTGAQYTSGQSNQFPSSNGSYYPPRPPYPPQPPMNNYNGAPFGVPPVNPYYNGSPYGNPYGDQYVPPYPPPHRMPPPPINDNEYCATFAPTPNAVDPSAPIPKPKKPPKGHNAFRNELSAASEVKRNYPALFEGDDPLPGETPLAYGERREKERNNVKTHSKELLRKSATKLSLLLLLFATMFMVFTQVFPFILEKLGISALPDGQTIYTAIIYLLVYPVSFSLIIYLGNMGETHRVGTFLRKPKCSPLFVLKWFVILVGASYTISLLYDIVITPFLEFIGIPQDNTLMLFTSPFDIVVNLVVLCVFAPLFEEILFRGTMLSNHMKFGAWHACIVTGLYFGMFHMNLQQFLYASVGGMILAMVALKSGSLITSIILHAALNFLNFFSMLTIYFLDNGAQIMEESWRPEGPVWAVVLFTLNNLLPYLFIIVAIVMLIVELCINRHALRLPKGDSGLTAREKAVSFITTPAVIAAFIVYAALIIFFTCIVPILNAAAPAA
ncbi:MAG: CPBP family intramembrane metalloprotease [Clostridia bacterium]|nr:CPBP family intramembrane metalloprotease [Clostridia bacterium]